MSLIYLFLFRDYFNANYNLRRKSCFMITNYFFFFLDNNNFFLIFANEVAWYYIISFTTRGSPTSCRLMEFKSIAANISIAKMFISDFACTIKNVCSYDSFLREERSWFKKWLSMSVVGVNKYVFGAGSAGLAGYRVPWGLLWPQL